MNQTKNKKQAVISYIKVGTKASWKVSQSNKKLFTLMI